MIGITHATSTKNKKLFKMLCLNIIDTIAARETVFLLRQFDELHVIA